MSLVDIMLDQLAAARRIVEDGAEVVPAWLITTPEGSYLIITPFDHNKPGQRERALFLISRFMAWRMASEFQYGPSVLDAFGHDDVAQYFDELHRLNSGYRSGYS